MRSIVKSFAGIRNELVVIVLKTMLVLPLSKVPLHFILERKHVA